MPDHAVEELVRSIEQPQPPPAGQSAARGRSGRDLGPMTKTHRARPRPPFNRIALVLQGGGALGSYQAGVYEALVQADLHPDWVAGISIGAINAAIIAGNEPANAVDKLRGFWESITPTPVALWWTEWLSDAIRGDTARAALNQVNALSALVAGAAGFFELRLPPPWLQPGG